MRATGSLVVRRLLHAIPVILIVATGVFVLLEIAPGDAVDSYLAHTGSGDAAMAEQLRQQLGLDQSIVVRFLAYLEALLTFDLGWSVAANAPVTAAIALRLPNTVLLMGAAIIVAAALGIVLGGFAAMRRGRPEDGIVSSIGLALNSMPNFWVALILIIIFGVGLGYREVEFDAFKAHVDSYKNTAREYGRDIRVWTLALIVQGETEKEAKAFHDYYVNEKGDWDAATNVLDTIGINAKTFPPGVLEGLKSHFIAGWGGYPLVGTKEQIVDGLHTLKRMGLDGVLLSWPRYLEGMKQFRDITYPLLKQSGLRDFGG